MSEKNLEKYSPEEWNHLRQRFQDSLLSDAEIANLGQGLGISWPFKGKGETASKYIQYDFEDLSTVPGLIGKPSRIKTLMNILRETLAFDDPFSDMVDSVEAEFGDDDVFENILNKYEIPPNYPQEFVHLKANTQEVLKRENIKTLLEAIHYGQKTGGGVGAGEDLRNFLNSLAHKDEAGIMRHLPYRRGIRGLHLAEAIGLIARDLPSTAQVQLLAQAGVDLTEEEQALLPESSSSETEASIKAAVEQVAKVMDWFTDEAEELNQVFSAGTAPERFFIFIDDRRCERMALALAKLHLGIDDNKKSGLFGRLFGR